METIYKSNAEQGFIVVTLLTSGTASSWASQFGSTHPVLELSASVGESIFASVPGYPTGGTIKPGMLINKTPIVGGGTFNASMIPPILP